MIKKTNKPTQEKIRKARETIQEYYNFNKKEAQEFCAKQLHVTGRSWERWEKGDRVMHQAFWDLLLIKLIDT